MSGHVSLCDFVCENVAPCPTYANVYIYLCFLGINDKWTSTDDEGVMPYFHRLGLLHDLHFETE